MKTKEKPVEAIFVKMLENKPKGESVSKINNEIKNYNYQAGQLGLMVSGGESAPAIFMPAK